MSKLRVYVADDHPIVRSGLKSLVSGEADMELVGEAGDGETAVREVLELRPDVVVMDMCMPGMNGTDAAALIHTDCPAVRVVILTAHEERGYLQRVMAAGACGYVLKRSAAADLVGAIRHSAAGGTSVDPAVAVLLPPAPEQSPGGDRPDLSEREVEVVRQIAQGYSNKQIAARLGLSVKTVETYKARAMEKLDARSRVDLVRYAATHGWLSHANPRA